LSFADLYERLGPGVPPHEDGYLQLELRRYVRRDGSARERGPYWYWKFQ